MMGLVGTVTSAFVLGAMVAAPQIDTEHSGAPQVTETRPMSGATLPPGPFTISVTFDQPMRRKSFSFVTTDKGRYPDCAKAPQQSADGHSFMLACKATEPGIYSIGFNSGRFRNFVSRRTALPATPVAVTFFVQR
jgi:hypothetical protein